MSKRDDASQSDETRSGTPTSGIRIHSFTAVELHAAHARRNRRGQKMTPARVAQARAMHAAGHSMMEIAERIGVSRSTVHRHLG